MSYSLGPRAANIVVIQVKDLQLALCEQFADGSGSAVSNHVVRKI